MDIWNCSKNNKSPTTAKKKKILTCFVRLFVSALYNFVFVQSKRGICGYLHGSWSTASFHDLIFVILKITIF